MNVLLDTNFYSSFCKGDEQAVRIIQRARKIYIPFDLRIEIREDFNLPPALKRISLQSRD